MVQSDLPNPSEDEKARKQNYDLEQLASESWQLELLVSGILLLLLFQSDDFIQSIVSWSSIMIQSGIMSILAVLVIIVPLAIGLSKLFFVIHVLLRGLWIGALGLRSVSGDIDLAQLKLNQSFASFLNKYNGSFDSYIHRLERAASVMFSFNFLLIFYSISFLLSISWVVLFAILTSTVSYWFLIPVVFLSIAVLLSGIDFLSMQRLKKGKFGYVYYPFYRVINILNLAFLYRSLHYNFMDTRYTRRLLGIVFSGGLIYLIVLGFNFEPSPWLAHVDTANTLTYNSTSYIKDLEKHFLEDAVLTSFENDKLLQATVPFRHSKLYQRRMLHTCPQLEKYTALSWFEIDTKNYNFTISTDSSAREEPKLRQLLNCYLEGLEFSIDEEIAAPTASLFYFNETQQVPSGIRVFFPLDSVPVGLHQLNINYMSMNRQDSIVNNNYIIPFYKL